MIPTCGIRWCYCYLSRAIPMGRERIPPTSFRLNTKAIAKAMSRRYVSNKNESVRMFKNDFLEACSHIHPLIVPSVWVPVTIGLTYLSVYARDLDTLPFIG